MLKFELGSKSFYGMEVFIKLYPSTVLIKLHHPQNIPNCTLYKVRNINLEYITFQPTKFIDL